MANTCPKCHTNNPSESKFCMECATPLPQVEEAVHTKTFETPREELTTGSTFAGRYQIIEELGKGGMGRVYKVLDLETKEKIALKLIKPEIASDKKTIERFRNELTTARKIAHRNVCRMYDLNKKEDNYYITMEFVSGGDLKKLIRRTKRLDTGTALSITKQICDGLSEAHRLGIVHRDLKPNNIMIDDDGNAQIMDFGIARTIQGKGITGSGVMIGTPEYMSPEQVEGKEADQRSDIYSLGIILYEMLTGRLPFEGDTPFTIGVKHKSEIPQDPKELNPQILDDLSSVILKCLEKDKENRYQSTGEVKSELGKIEERMPTKERSEPKKQPPTSKEITVSIRLKKFIIPALIATFAIIAVVVIWQLLPKKEMVPAEPSKSSIAVLPFEDLSPEKDQEFFCDGLANSIINALSNIDDLSVRARGSSFLFKDTHQDLQEIATKLNVDVVLEGTVQKMENRFRITAQLVNITDKSVLWSDQYNQEQRDVFAIQDEITLAIVNNLRIELLGGKKAKLVKRYTEDIEAFNLYSKGIFSLNIRAAEEIKKAIQYFTQAIEKDQGYALAYAGLADAHILLTDYGNFTPSELHQAAIKAKEAAFKALEIDNTLAEAHASLGRIKYIFDWDWNGAERKIMRAIELNPGNADIRYSYAYMLMLMARFEESIREMKIALELDPLSLIINRNLGQVFYRARQHDQAIETLQDTLEMDPNFSMTHFYLGTVYLQKSMYKKALTEFQKEKEIRKGYYLYSDAMVAATTALMGDRNDALQMRNDLMEQSKNVYINPYFIASIHAAFGENDLCLNWLERAYEEHDAYLRWLNVDPLYDNVRSDLRFKALLKKIGFEI